MEITNNFMAFMVTLSRAQLCFLQPTDLNYILYTVLLLQCDLPPRQRVEPGKGTLGRDANHFRPPHLFLLIQ